MGEDVTGVEGNKKKRVDNEGEEAGEKEESIEVATERVRGGVSMYILVLVVG